MRQASNQKELIVAQRKLARFQRIAEEKGELAAKVVTHTPSWIFEDAKKQAEWVATKKKEKEDKENASHDSISLAQQPSTPNNKSFSSKTSASLPVTSMPVPELPSP